ncbi:ATP-binding protein [Emcibacter sp.]|uniref:ATP-binding protein n=1 Tax=Emcibacter sp. TaxID=1979954 RepID=UPI002AA775B5|nr:ATP-binding protein [Emcibacter sp.]
MWIATGLLFLVAFSYFSLNVLWNQKEKEVSLQLTRIDGLEKQFNRLSMMFGYGGFIHDFKNYVLRGDRKYLDLAEDDFKAVLPLWKELHGRLDGLEQEKKYIQEMLDNYGRSLSIAQGTSFISAEDLDRRVAVDDTPAHQAIVTLNNYILQILEKTIRQRLDLEDVRHRSTILISSLAVSLTILIIMHFLIRRETAKAREKDKQVQQTIEALGREINSLEYNSRVLNLQHEQAEKLGGFGTWLLNLQNNRFYWSDGIFEIHGRDPARGVPSAEESARYYTEPARRTALSQMGEAARTKSGYSIKHDLVRDDGEKRRIASVGQYMEYNGVPYLIGVFRDITNEHLLEKTLRDAAKTANEIAKSRSDILAVMSHEIRTPINGVMGVLQLLETMDLPGKAQELVDMGMQSSEQLLTVINDLLEMSRLQSGKVQLLEEPFNMGHAVKSAAHLHAAIAHSKGLELEVDIPEHSPPILVGDEVRIKQVVGNLVSNAVKFTLEGGVYISVHFHDSGLENTVETEIRVQDTGIGIPADRLGDLFQPFEQIEDAYRRQFGGTGLGLSICQSLADLMGGSISVDSEEGEGTTFTFRFALELASEEIKECRLLLDPGHIAGLKALVVEDVELNVRLMQKVLVERWKLDVTFARDGQEAIDICMENNFDVILMDIQMPVLDGIEASRIIRSSMLHHRNTPIIAVTANAMKDEVALYYDAGMQHCITKPVDWGEMAYILKHLKELRIQMSDTNCLKTPVWLTGAMLKVFETKTDSEETERFRINLRMRQDKLHSIVRKLDIERNKPSVLVSIAQDLRNMDRQFEYDLLKNFAATLEKSIYDPIAVQRLSLELASVVDQLSYPDKISKVVSV